MNNKIIDMPIKKQNFELYPPNWRKISWWIIRIRAESRCEGILENGERCGAENHKLHPITGKKVVLSVAHLDHDPRNSDQNLPPGAPLEQSNMRAFCQRCHNRWDREHRNESIKQTYREKHGEIISDAELANKVLINLAGFTKEEVEDDDLFNEVPGAEEYFRAEIEHQKNVSLPEEIDDLKIYMEETEKYAVEKLKETLQQLILRLPPTETREHNLFLKTIELQEEYAKLLNMTTQEFSTPQVQAQLTVYKQKLSVIDGLMGLSRLTGKIIPKLQASQPESIEPEVINTAALNVRGLGIRKFLLNKRNGTVE